MYRVAAAGHPGPFTTHACMFYSCPWVPCFQQISCGSRDGRRTDATGRFCITHTFSKRAHLLVKPVKRINSGVLRLERFHLHYVSSALMFYPLKQRGNGFPWRRTFNSAPRLSGVIYRGPSMVGQARFEKQIKNFALLKFWALADITNHAVLGGEAQSWSAVWPLSFAQRSRR